MRACLDIKITGYSAQKDLQIYYSAYRAKFLANAVLSCLRSEN
jgi:hypothetical protein